MAPSSSTSSSDPHVRTALAWLGLLAAAWASYLLLAPEIASWIGARFGGRILALGEGHIEDPVAFAQHRGRDAVQMLTAAVVLGQLAWHGGRLLTRRMAAVWRWLPLSVLWFSALNGFLWVAGRTGLWWMVVYSAHPNLQLAAFEIERVLLEEANPPIRLVVLGSSQGQSEIATGELNGYGHGEVRAANLSFAGADAADFILMREQYRTIDPQVVVIYLSPINLYGGFTGTRWTPLLTSRGLVELQSVGALALGERARLLQGVLGLGLPMVRQRVALQHAIFGTISEQGYRRPPDPSSPRRGPPGSGSLARNEAKSYSLDPAPAAFQIRALEEFLRAEATKGRHMVVIDGSVHPELMAAFEPDILEGYAAVLRRLETFHSNVTVLRDELPSHTPADYADLYHIRPEARTEFTRALARVLAERLDLPFITAGR